MQCLKCKRCDNFYHTEDPKAEDHNCKEFSISFRWKISNPYRDYNETYSKWDVKTVWARNLREAYREILSDQFFRDGRSDTSDMFKIQMKNKDGRRVFIGTARRKYEIVVKPERQESECPYE